MGKVNVQNVIDNGKMNKFYTSVFFTIFLVVFLDGYDQSVYTATLTPLMKDLNLGAVATGLLTSVTFWGAMVGAILFSVLADKIGRKKVIIFCVALYTVFTGLCGIIQNVYLFAAFRFFAGMGIAAITPIGTALLSEYSPSEQRRFITINGTLAMPVGLIAGPLLGLLIMPSLGWRSLYFLAFVGIISMPLLLKLPETMVILVKKHENSKIAAILKKAVPSFEPKPDDEYIVNTTEDVKLSITCLFKNGLAWNTIIIWIMFFVNMFIGTAFTWLPKIITMMGYSLTNALALTTISYVGMFVGTIISSRIANKIGYKKTLLGCYILTALFMFSFTIKTNLVVFAILLFLYGVANVMQCIIYAYTASNYPISIRTTAMGAGATVTRLASALAPVVIGVFISAGMQPTGIFRMLIFPIVIAAIAVSLARKPKFDSQEA